MTNNVPISARVIKLEAKVEELTNALEVSATSLKEALEVIQKLTEDKAFVKEKFERISHLFANLDSIIEDFQVRHVALTQVLINKQEVTEEALETTARELRTEVLDQKMKSLIDNGTLEPSDVIDQISMIVFQETKDDGKVTISRAQYDWRTINERLGEDVAKLFLSKKVGETFKLDKESDRNVTILEIYRQVL